MATPVMSPMVVGRKTSNKDGFQDHRRKGSWLSRLGRRLSLTGVPGPTSPYQGTRKGTGGMNRNPAFFPKDQEVEHYSVENPMFGVRAPSFSSPKAAREDRRSIRMSRKQSTQSHQTDVEAVLDDMDYTTGTERDDVEEFGDEMNHRFTVLDEVQENVPDVVITRHKKGKTKSNHKGRSKSKKSSRRRGASKGAGSKEDKVRPAINSYKRQSSEVEVGEWVNRMDAIMALRRKHSSFRKSVILERPAEEPSEEDMAIC